MSSPNNQEHLVDRKAYPELDGILWDRTDRYIEMADAYAAYERRWRYVNAQCMSASEAQLLSALIRDIGKGMFLSS